MTMAKKPTSPAGLRSLMNSPFGFLQRLVHPADGVQADLDRHGQRNQVLLFKAAAVLVVPVLKRVGPRELQVLQRRVDLRSGLAEISQGHFVFPVFRTRHADPPRMILRYSEYGRRPGSLHGRAMSLVAKRISASRFNRKARRQNLPTGQKNCQMYRIGDATPRRASRASRGTRQDRRPRWLPDSL